MQNDVVTEIKDLYIMNVKSLNIAYMAAALAFAGCTGSNGAADGKLLSMNVEESFDIDSLDNLSDRMRVVNVCRPEFTDSSMLNRFIVGGVVDNRIYIKNQGYDHGNSWVCTFSYPDGKLTDAFNPFGAGPEECARGYEGVFTEGDGGMWSILDQDFSFGMIKQYTADGKYLRSVRNDSIQNLAAAAGGGWLAFNEPLSFDGGPHVTREKDLYLYSHDWQPDGTIRMKSRRWGIFVTQLMDIITTLRGENYVNDLDTIYRVNCQDHSLEPHIAMNLGKYAYDWGSLETMEELKAVDNDHLNPLHPIFNSRYALVRYTFGEYNNGGVLRFDAYSLEDGKLVYRHEQPQGRDADWLAGFPVTVDGETYYGYPADYMNSDNFYFIISADEMARVKGTDDVNPMIVEVEIK